MYKVEKIGLGIVAFDDITHIKNICAEVRDLCDVIIVCLQEKSYFGYPITKDVIDYVKKRACPGDSVLVMGARDNSLTDFAHDILKAIGGVHE